MIRRARERVFYGWWIVATGVAVQFLQAALFLRPYGAYVVLLREEFGWSKTALSAAFSLSRTESGLLGPIEGWLIDRFGPRAVMRVGVVMFGAGFMLLSTVNSLPMFYAVFMLISLGGTLGGFMPVMVAIVNWFERRRAMALGIMSIGLGIGGLITPAIVWSLETFGWRETAFASGVLILLVGLPMSQLIYHRPEQLGYTVDGDPPHPHSPGSPAVSASINFTAAEAMRTGAFWYLSLGHGSALLVVNAVLVHVVVHLTENLGYSLTTAGFVMALLTAGQLLGQVVGGFLGDRFSKRWIATACMMGHAIGLLLVAYAVALWMVLAFATLHGLAWGMRGPLMSAMRADYFGSASFGTITGFSSLIIMFGTTGGPIIAGVLADRTGSYEAGFTILALMAAAGSIFFVLSTKPKPPLRLRSMPVPVSGSGASDAAAGAAAND